jgi:HD-GYP domain-containing protein (c-di-GMP phosphodiesterase class II)
VSKRPRSLQLVLVAIVSTATATGLLLMVEIGHHWPAAVAFGLVAATFQLFPARVNDDVQVSLTIVADLVAILYGGAAFAVVTSLAAGAVVVGRMQGDRLFKGAYNIATLVLAAVAAAQIFVLVAGVNPVTSVGQGEFLAASPRWLLALLAASVMYVILNGALIAAAVSLSSRVPFFRTFVGLTTQALFLEVMYAGLAAMAFVLIVRVHPLAVALLAVPLVVARRALLSLQEQRSAFDRMVRAFVKAIEVKDGYTRGHAERVADLSVAVAARMGVSYDDRQRIRYGALLHDVGKIGVALGVLCKAGPLDDAEFEQMKTHPVIGARVLHDVDFLGPALGIVRHHHERLDGHGYPAGLTGTEIPLLTRIVTVVDAFDAMTSTRPYRRALDVESALAELQRHTGTQFDHEVVQILVTHITEKGWQITDERVAVVGDSTIHDHVSEVITIADSMAAG